MNNYATRAGSRETLSEIMEYPHSRVSIISLGACEYISRMTFVLYDIWVDYYERNYPALDLSLIDYANTSTRDNSLLNDIQLQFHNHPNYGVVDINRFGMGRIFANECFFRFLADLTYQIFYHAGMRRHNLIYDAMIACTRSVKENQFSYLPRRRAFLESIPFYVRFDPDEVKLVLENDPDFVVKNKSTGVYHSVLDNGNHLKIAEEMNLKACRYLSSFLCYLFVDNATPQTSSFLGEPENGTFLKFLDHFEDLFNYVVSFVSRSSDLEFERCSPYSFHVNRTTLEVMFTLPH